MNKKERLLQYKQWSNIPRYDLAIKKTSSGYQQATPFEVGTPSIQQGQDMSGEVEESKPTIQNAISSATPYYSLFKSPLKKWATYNSAARSVAGNAANSMLSPIGNTLANYGTSVMPSFTQQAANFGANAFKSSIGSPALTNATGQLAQEGTKQTLKSTLGTLGTAASVAGAAYGLYNLGSGLAKGPNIPNASLMDKSHDETTQSINGVDYTTKSLGNTSQFEQMLKNNENSRLLSNSISGVGAGVGTALATGALAGTSLGLPGIIVGGLLGGLIGGIGSLIGRNKRKQELQKRINGLTQSYDNYNTQSESVAASQGMRNDFYDNTYDQSGLYNADKGKTAIPYNLMNGNAPAGYGMVFDKDGYHFGPRNARIGKGETVINYNEGKLAYVDKGKKRADDQYTSAQEGDDNYIAGNDIDITNGVSFADQVAPASKRYMQLEEMKNRIQKSKHGDEKTKQLNLQQIKQMQQQLVESTKEPMKRQDMQHNMQNQYDGYMPQYSHGKFDFSWVQPLMYLGAYGIPNKQYDYYKNSVPYAANSYVRNANADRALNTLAQLRYDPYDQVRALRSAYGQGLYGIRQQGGLSAGQRMNMMSSINNNYMNNLAKIYAGASEQNNKYAETYAKAALESGNQEATRQQTALAQQQQAYQAAVARRLAGMESANQGKLNILSSLGKGIMQQMNYNAAQDYNNRLLNYYDKDIELKNKGLRYGLYN